MSKTSDFAHAFASNLPIEGVEWEIEGKTCKVRINNDDIHTTFEIKLNITKINNKGEVWEDGHFVGQCSGDNQVDLSNKLTKILTTEIETRGEKQTLKEVNDELCNYLTGEMEKNGFTIINRASGEDYGIYIVQGPSGDQYQIRATYTNAEVTVSRVLNDRDTLKAARTFNLSNPEIEKVICQALTEYDSDEVSEKQKNELVKLAHDAIIDDIYCDAYDGEWEINVKGDLVTMGTEDDRHELKYRVKIELEEIR